MPNASPGFFGKLPSAGDFVQRRLSPGFVDVWDGHFESAVAEARRVLGDGWHETYHASPVWRFVLAPGCCGDAAWLGVMGPGADRVGRCFPMVIATVLDGGTAGCAQALGSAHRWLDAAERVHQTAQADPGMSVEAFDALVAALGDPLTVTTSGDLSGIDLSGPGHWRIALPPSDAPAAFLGDLWMRMGQASNHGGLWWTTGAARVPACALVTASLPQPSAYAGFLDAACAEDMWQSTGAGVSFAAPVQSVPPPLPDLDDLLATPMPAAAELPPSTEAWLPDDLDLLSGFAPPAGLPATPQLPDDDSTEIVPATIAGAGVHVSHQADGALTVVAAQQGPAHPRQRGVAAVSAVVEDLSDNELAGGVPLLRSRVMALNPSLCEAGRDLIDPIAEDCAVIAAHVTGEQASLLRIGAAAAWHWRGGRFQPIFAIDGGCAQVDTGGDIDDLLFSPAQRSVPGLGAAETPVCQEVVCELEGGDRLLLMATQQLLQLPPEVLMRGLEAGSCDEARTHIATAAGFDSDAARWPLAIIGIDA